MQGISYLTTKSKIRIAVSIVLVGILVLFFCFDVVSEKPTDAIMVDGIVYYSTEQEMPVEFDESSIRKIISYTEGVPTQNGQANFDPELGNQYAKYGEDIAVLLNHEWVHFKAK